MIISKNHQPANLYIINSFPNAQRSSTSRILLDFFKEVRFFETRKAAIKSAAAKKPHKLFIDSDVGLRNQLYLCLAKARSPASEIHIYEEGIGTYRTNIVCSKTKHLIYKATGTACYFGDSFITKKIHIFDTNKHSRELPSLRQKQVKIPSNLQSWINSNESKVIEIFSENFHIPEPQKPGIAYIYLSDWVIDDSKLKSTHEDSTTFIKPHPHITNKEITEHKNKNPSAIWIPGSLPAEVALSILSRKYRKVFVKHNNSSAFHYMSHLKNLTEI